MPSIWRALVAALALALMPGPALASEPLETPIVRLVGEPGTTFTVTGGRYADTIEVRPAPDGRLVLVNELDTDAYVEGLAEMPASWPLEALKAQAVAARTYAWYSISLGTFHRRGLGFDICATVDCQVFKGRAIVESPGGERWAQAVAETAGETLLWDGRPILARYFSSSGGHTRNNEHVFGTRTGPRPYLQGVPDPDESISPHHRWRFELSRAEFDTLLSHGHTLRHAVPVREIRWIPGDADRVDQIRVTSQSGHVVEVSASKFRAWVSDVGPRVLPSRFPVKVDGRPLPDGLPTSRLRFCLTCKSGVVVIEGRGWGHGVGMSQWGARGKAERDVSYDDILAAYYNGLRPEVSPSLPERVRVGLTWTADSVEVTADGPFRVVTADAVSTRQEGEVWRVEARSDKAVHAHGPDGEWVRHEAAEPEAPEAEPAAREAPDAEPVAAETPDVEPLPLADHLRRAVSYVAPVPARLLRLLAP